MKPQIAAALLSAAAAAAAAHAQTTPNCYDTGQGPIMTCIDGGRPIQVRRAFIYRVDSKNYAYDHHMRTYCYRNEYGNPHCIQSTLITHLRCVEPKPGQLVCE